jgi:hypothetical protein
MLTSSYFARAPERLLLFIACCPQPGLLIVAEGMPGPNPLLEGVRFIVGLHPELRSEDFYAPLVLVNCRSTIAGQAVEPHKASVRAFARWVDAECEGCVRNTSLHVPLDLEAGKEPIQDLEIDLSQALPLVDAPLLVPPLKKFSPVELNGMPQGFRIE